MKAMVYTTGQKLLVECRANYKKNESKLYLWTSSEVGGQSSNYRVHFTDSASGLYEFDCEYDSQERNGLHYLTTLNVLEVISYIQRRHDLKIKTNVPVTAVLLDYDNKVTVDPESQKAKQVRVYLRDISAGGIMIATKADLEEGQRMMIPFDKGSSPILVNAQIIRANRSEHEEHIYGCRFYNMNAIKEAVIREYVFRLQAATKFKAASEYD